MPRRAGNGRRSIRLAMTRYSVGAMQSTPTRSRSSSSRRSAGSKRDVEKGGRAPQPGCDEDIAGRLRPAARGGAPDQLPGRRVEPLLGLQTLAGQIALRMHDTAGLAGGAAGECDQTRLIRIEIDRRGGLCGEQARVGDAQDGAGQALELSQVALVGDDQSGLRKTDSQLEVLRAELLGAGQDDGTDAKAGDHRQDPLGAVSDQGHDDIAALYSTCLQRSCQACRAIGDLAEAPLAPGAVACQLDEGKALGRCGVDDLSGEVHGWREG